MRSELSVKGVKLGTIFTIFSVIASIVIPITISTTYIGVDQTINSLAFPNGFIKRDFNTSEPWVQYSFFIKNYNQATLNLELNLEIHAQYYPTGTEQLIQTKIFDIKSTYPQITPAESLSIINNATQTYFDFQALQDFWNDVNSSKPYQFLMNVKFKGTYLFSLITFEVRISSLNITDYEL